VEENRREGNDFSFFYFSLKAENKKTTIENLSEPLENRLNPLIYKAHKEFNFSPKR